MRRSAWALLAVCVLAAPAAAQLGSGLPECERSYRELWLGVLPSVAKDLTGGELAQLHRYALRSYEGCTSGDERVRAEEFFRNLASVRGANVKQRLDDLLKSLPEK